MSLQDFLLSNPINNLTEEVIVSSRFKDKDGSPLKFTIRAMTSKEFDSLRKATTELRKGRKVEFDTHKFSVQVVVNHVVNPDFKNAEAIAKLGVSLPEEYVEQVLLAGELTTLTNKIQQLSGFDVGMDALVEEAKN